MRSDKVMYRPLIQQMRIQIGIVSQGGARAEIACCPTVKIFRVVGNLHQASVVNPE